MSAGLRILVHDYAGHPFQLELSRALAHRGHTVRHVYCGSIGNTARGNTARLADDPETFSIEPITLAQPIQKYSYVKRWAQEKTYGRKLAAALDDFRPTVVLSANTPLDAQRILQKNCRRAGIRFVFWVQDLLGIATERVLKRRMPVFGKRIGQHYVEMEKTLLRQSDAIVLITEDFRPVMQKWGIPPSRVTVIENWAPLAELPMRPKANPWAEAQGLADKRCLLYAGNLGMKHNPQHLVETARMLRGQDDVRVVVVSEGLGADWLREQQAAEGLDNLTLLPFQPFEALPEVLATGDVLMALLEPDAGVFSVPSKVLSYLCAGRPVLLAIPVENLAARIVEQQQAGRIIPPDEPAAFAREAQHLIHNEALRHRLGINARRYAETTFDIDAITGRFEQILAPR